MSITAAYAPATTQGPIQVSRTSTGPKNQQPPPPKKTGSHTNAVTGLRRSLSAQSYSNSAREKKSGQQQPTPKKRTITRARAVLGRCVGAFEVGLVSWGEAGVGRDPPPLEDAVLAVQVLRQKVPWLAGTHRHNIVTLSGLAKAHALVGRHPQAPPETVGVRQKVHRHTHARTRIHRHAVVTISWLAKANTLVMQ